MAENKRIKVVNDPTELVPILRALDTKVKRAVLSDVSGKWCTVKFIEDKYGTEGKEALFFFEKMKLVESKWEPNASASEKAYHSFYGAFHINTSCTIGEINDILTAAVMGEKEFDRLDGELFELAGDRGVFAGDAAEELGLSPLLLKAVVRRSTRLDFRGHRVERVTV